MSLLDEKRLEKNKRIGLAGKATKERHALWTCKTFKFKIDQSHLNQSQKESLKMFFVEAKRVYNYIIGDMKNGNDVFDYDYKKLRNISYLDKDKNKIDYNISYVGSSVLQSIIEQIKFSIYGLSASKKNGNKIGTLKFKSECNSIVLKQYGITHEIRGSRIKIQGIKKPVRVSGIKQLNGYNNIDYTSANLLYDGYDYFISLTCFIDPSKNQNKKNIHQRKDIIGLDFGCESTITLSDGQKMKVLVGESERLKGLQAKLATKKKRSNNWYKVRSLVRKEYNKMKNKKNDLSNKIVHDLVSSYKTIVIQDDPINKWQQGDFTSKTVQHSILGRLKSTLKSKENVVVLDKWFPTTKHCFNCGSDVELELSDRTFVCPNCKHQDDRDIHAAKNMIEFYKTYNDLKGQPAGTVGLMPERKVSYKSYKTLTDRKLSRL